VRTGTCVRHGHVVTTAIPRRHVPQHIHSDTGGAVVAHVSTRAVAPLHHRLRRHVQRGNVARTPVPPRGAACEGADSTQNHQDGTSKHSNHERRRDRLACRHGRLRTLQAWYGRSHDPARFVAQEEFSRVACDCISVVRLACDRLVRWIRTSRRTHKQGRRSRRDTAACVNHPSAKSPSSRRRFCMPGRSCDSSVPSSPSPLLINYSAQHEHGSPSGRQFDTCRLAGAGQSIASTGSGGSGGWVS